MNERDYISIEAYLSDELSAPEKIAFEARLSTEPDLATTLADRRLLHEHLSAEATEKDLRATTNKLNERYFPAEKGGAVVRKIGPARRWVAGIVAVAAIALLVFFGGNLLTPGPASAYEQFAQHEPLSLTERGAAANAAAAEAAFNAGRYVEAADLLRDYLSRQADDQRAKLALGVSLLETNRDTQAIKIFTEIAEGGSSLAPYGNWYLALAAVKRGENKVALDYLDLIPAGDAYLAEKVAKLKATL
jgi:predicted Zn-dependent protease